MDPDFGVPPGYPGTAPQPEQYAYTTVNQSVGGTLDLYDVWFLDASTGYVVGEAGTVYRTTNGGATWLLISGGSLTARVRRALTAVTIQ